MRGRPSYREARSTTPHLGSIAGVGRYFFGEDRILDKAFIVLRNDLKTPLCHSELVSESPDDGNNPDEILKQVQDDTLVYVLR